MGQLFLFIIGLLIAGAIVNVILMYRHECEQNKHLTSLLADHQSEYNNLYYELLDQRVTSARLRLKLFRVLRHERLPKEPTLNPWIWVDDDLPEVNDYVLMEITDDQYTAFKVEDDLDLRFVKECAVRWQMIIS